MHHEVLHPSCTHMHASSTFSSFFLSIDGVELGQGSGVPWGIHFAQAQPLSHKAFMATLEVWSFCEATFMGSPRNLPYLHSHLKSPSLCKFGYLGDGSFWANQPTNQPKMLGTVINYA